jgi:hypothetical protein
VKELHPAAFTNKIFSGHTFFSFFCGLVLSGRCSLLAFEPELQPAEMLAFQPERTIPLVVRAGTGHAAVSRESDGVRVSRGLDLPTVINWKEFPAVMSHSFFSRLLPLLLFGRDVKSLHLPPSP